MRLLNFNDCLLPPHLPEISRVRDTTLMVALLAYAMGACAPVSAWFSAH